MVPDLDWREYGNLQQERIADIYVSLPEDNICEITKLLSWGDYRNGFNRHVYPECGAQMVESVVYAYFADREWRKLWETHLLGGGYFRIKKGP